MKIKLKDVEAFQVLLLQKGLSQRELARAAKIHEAYASMIIRETHSPGPRVAARICEVLEVAFDDIFYVDRGCEK